MRKTAIAVLAIGAAIFACFPSLDHLEHDAPTTPDVSEGGADASVDAPPDAVGDDSGCKLPVAVVAPTELASAMKFCNLDQMLTIDGETGGIYRDDPNKAIELTFDGHDVTSCAAFDYGDPIDATKIVMGVKASQKTCTHQCNSTVAAGDGCNSGDFFWLYVGPSPKLADAKFVTQIVLQAPMHDVEMHTYDQGFPAVDKRYVFICRSSAGVERDDIEIDGVRLCPR